MRFEDVLFHPYYDTIKKKCFDDEPATQISNWVKNTVDQDANIEADKKEEYYLSDKKINAYKKLLMEQTKEISTSIERAMPSTAPAKVVDGTVVTDEKRVYAPIIVKDVERHVLNINESFLNLFNLVQSRLLELMSKSEDFQGMIDLGLEKTIRGYMSELRQIFDLYCKMTGREEFAKTLGAKAGQAVAENILSETKVYKLRLFIRDLLAEVDPQQISSKLAELDDILNGK